MSNAAARDNLIRLELRLDAVLDELELRWGSGPYQIIKDLRIEADMLQASISLAAAA